MPTFTHYPVPAPMEYYPYGEVIASVCEGPDGNLWCSSQSTENLYVMSPGGTTLAVPFLGLVIAQGHGGVGSLLETGVGMAGGTVVLGSDGRVWAGSSAISLSGGSLVETSYGAGVYADFCLGPDGNIWLTDDYSDLLWCCTPAGVLTSYSLSFRPNVICALGSYLYVSQLYSGSNLAQVDTSGTVIASTTALHCGSEILGMAAGPDGNLWVGGNSAQYNSVSPNLAIVGLYSLTPLLTGCEYPITGPDGNLWYVGYLNPGHHGYLVSMNPLGPPVPVPTLYMIGAGVYPNGVAVGPSNTLWIPDQDGGIWQAQLP